MKILLFLLIFVSFFCTHTSCVRGKDNTKIYKETDETFELIKNACDVADEAIDLFNILRADCISAMEISWQDDERQKIAYMTSARKTSNKAHEAIIQMNNILNIYESQTIFAKLSAEYISFFENVIGASEEAYRFFENPVKYCHSDPDMSKTANYIININIHHENIQILNEKLNTQIQNEKLD